MAPANSCDATPSPARNDDAPRSCQGCECNGVTSHAESRDATKTANTLALLSEPRNAEPVNTSTTCAEDVVLTADWPAGFCDAMAAEGKKRGRGLSQRCSVSKPGLDTPASCQDAAFDLFEDPKEVHKVPA